MKTLFSQVVLSVDGILPDFGILCSHLNIKIEHTAISGFGVLVDTHNGDKFVNHFSVSRNLKTVFSITLCTIIITFFALYY